MTSTHERTYIFHDRYTIQTTPKFNKAVTLRSLSPLELAGGKNRSKNIFRPSKSPRRERQTISPDYIPAQNDGKIVEFLGQFQLEPVTCVCVAVSIIGHVDELAKLKVWKRPWIRGTLTIFFSSFFRDRFLMLFVTWLKYIGVLICNCLSS